MTFQTLNPAPGRRTDEVSVSIARHANRPGRIRITFHHGLCKKMAWDDATLVEVSVGEGPDLGMIRLKPATVKGFTLRKTERGSRLVVYLPVGLGTPDFWRSGAAEYGLNPNDRSMTIRLPWGSKPNLRAVG